MDMISHIYRDDKDSWHIQSNEEHLEGVAKLAEGFADEFGMGSWGKVLGLLHDKGKERKAFQDYIKKNSGYAPDLPVGEHNHAFVGGILAKKMYGKGSESLLCNQIMSHHSGLHDYCDIEKALTDEIPSEMNQCVDKIPLCRQPFQFTTIPGHKGLTADANHLSRMLFSCLVDADYLDTEMFMDEEAAKTRINDVSIESLLPMLEKHIDNLQKGSAKTGVNAIRRQVYERCVSMSDVEKRFL